MKKLVAMILALAMCLVALGALAEAKVAFNDPAAVRPESIEYPTTDFPGTPPRN